MEHTPAPKLGPGETAVPFDPRHRCEIGACPHVQHCRGIQECYQEDKDSRAAREAGVERPERSPQNGHEAFKHVDTTGTLERVNPIRDVLQEFPFAMYAVAAITAYGARKHTPRSWRNSVYTTGREKDHQGQIAYHTGKIGRHLIRGEVEGDVNHEDGGNLHSAAVAWNALAMLDTILRAESERTGITDPQKLLDRIKGESEC